MIINGRSYDIDVWRFYRTRYLLRYVWLKRYFPTLARYYGRNRHF